MNEIDPRDLYNVITANPNDYLFIDVRDPDVYAAAHPKGAINIPIALLVTQHYMLPHTGKKIALTCTTGQLATIAYGYLQNLGFTNLLHVTGGLENWTVEGLPAEGTRVTNGLAPTPMSPDGASATP